MFPPFDAVVLVYYVLISGAREGNLFFSVHGRPGFRPLRASSRPVRVVTGWSVNHNRRLYNVLFSKYTLIRTRSHAPGMTETNRIYPHGKPLRGEIENEEVKKRIDSMHKKNLFKLQMMPSFDPHL